MLKVLIPDGNCWKWNASKNKEGYGSVRYNGSIRLAHRVSYELFVAKPLSNELVCHHCDNTSCVNPKHLFLGTNQTNTDDKVKKKRHAYGQKAGTVKLTEKLVLKIRKQYALGNFTTRALGEKYGTTGSVISQIVNRKTWKHI